MPTLTSDHRPLTIASGTMSLRCLAFLLIAVAATANAQTLYRWKDQHGSTHVSDKPPPESCTSADCRAYREEVDRKLKEAKRAEEERKAQAKKEEEDFKKMTLQEMAAYHSRKAAEKLIDCTYTEKCSPSDIKRNIESIATGTHRIVAEGLIGRPLREQIIGNTTYCHYDFKGISALIRWNGSQFMDVSIF